MSGVQFAADVYVDIGHQVFLLTVADECARQDIVGGGVGVLAALQRVDHVLL